MSVVLILTGPTRLKSGTLLFMPRIQIKFHLFVPFRQSEAQRPGGKLRYVVGGLPRINVFTARCCHSKGERTKSGIQNVYIMVGSPLVTVFVSILFSSLLRFTLLSDFVSRFRLLLLNRGRRPLILVRLLTFFRPRR